MNQLDHTFPEREALALNALFKGVSPSVLVVAESVTDLVHFSAHETIFEQGAPGDYLYLVIGGSVRIRKHTAEGPAESVFQLRAGEFFGDMALFDPAGRSAEAQAIERSVLGRIDYQGLEQLLQVAPIELHRNLLQNAIRRLRDADRHFFKAMIKAERLSLLGTMLGTMIHDFRNPMSVIMGATDILEERFPEPEVHRWTGKIHRAAVQMREMAEEVLEFSRGTLTLRREPVTIARLLAMLDEQILDQLPRLGIEVVREVAYEGRLSIDPNRFARLLVNLIKNSTEAMPHGGVLRIAVRRTDDVLTVAVSDTGCGIPPEVLPTIFEPFVTYGKAGGTGLGMAIVKSVV
jgi:signal transduction histidine kinase